MGKNGRERELIESESVLIGKLCFCFWTLSLLPPNVKISHLEAVGIKKKVDYFPLPAALNTVQATQGPCSGRKARAIIKSIKWPHIFSLKLICRSFVTKCQTEKNINTTTLQETHTKTLNSYSSSELMTAVLSFSYGLPLSVPRRGTPWTRSQQYFVRKIAQRNDLSLHLIMRPHETFISILSVCSSMVCAGSIFSDVFIPAAVLWGFCSNLQGRKTHHILKGPFLQEILK